MKVEVVKKPLGFYRAKVWIELRPGSPYVSPFAAGYRIVTAWGRSEVSAAERCARKAERIKRYDDEWDQRRQERTSYVEVES